MESKYPTLSTLDVAKAQESNSAQVREIYKNDGCCGGNGPNCKCK